MGRKENGKAGKESGKVSVIYRYITDHPKFISLKQHVVISHCSVGQEFGRALRLWNDERTSEEQF